MPNVEVIVDEQIVTATPVDTTVTVEASEQSVTVDVTDTYVNLTVDSNTVTVAVTDTLVALNVTDADVTVEVGTSGPQGAVGEGVPAGGTGGQILAKIDATDYNTEWIDNFTSQVKHLVKNASGSTMPKGSVVFISGAQGTNMTVSLADADSDSTSATTIGFLESTLINNAQGYVVTEGLLAGLDTSTATIGDPVWLSPTAGEVLYGLANKPHAPVHLVYLGTVTRVSATVGEIFIAVNNGWELSELHDTLITNPTDNQVLTYEASTNLWKNKPVSASAGNYTHNQISVSSTWSITHNLGYRPNITLLDSAGGNIVGDITYIDANSLSVAFSVATSGVAYLS